MTRMEFIEKCKEAEETWAEEATCSGSALRCIQNLDAVKVSDDEVKMPKLWYDGIVGELEKAEEANQKLLKLLYEIRFGDL